MRLLSRSDIKGPQIYAGIREDYRRRIIEIKKHRRITVGDRVTLVFENRHTLIFQVEEMLRAESITQADKIQDELDVYNALMPTETELSATLFLEVPRDENAREVLDQLIGLDEHVVLRIGKHEVHAAFERGRSTADRISAVQYTRYPLSDEAKRALVTPDTPVSVVIDHPHYSHSASCSEAMRASLAADVENA